MRRARLEWREHGCYPPTYKPLNINPTELDSSTSRVPTKMFPESEGDDGETPRGCARILGATRIIRNENLVKVRRDMEEEKWHLKKSNKVIIS